MLIKVSDQMRVSTRFLKSRRDSHWSLTALENWRREWNGSDGLALTGLESLYS